MKYSLAEQFQTAEWSRPSRPPEYFVDYTRERQSQGTIFGNHGGGRGSRYKRFFALRITLSTLSRLKYMLERTGFEITPTTSARRQGRFPKDGWRRWANFIGHACSGSKATVILIPASVCPP